MEEIIGGAKDQSSPGILILDLNNRLLYSNQEALSFLTSPNEICSEVRCLCEQVKAHAKRHGSSAASNGHRSLRFRHHESSYSLRAFFIGARSNGCPATHLMVLVEKVAEQRSRLSMDILQAQAKCLIGEAVARRA